MITNKKYTLYLLCGVLITVAVITGICFIFFYQTYLPSSKGYDIDGYFTNIKKDDWLITGAGLSEEQCSRFGVTDQVNDDIKENYPLYSVFTADLVVTNRSDMDLGSVWCLYPGSRMYSDENGVHATSPKKIGDRQVWININSNADVFTCASGENTETVEIIVNTKGLSKWRLNLLLRNLQINLQIGVSESDSGKAISLKKDRYITVPVYYKKSS